MRTANLIWTGSGDAECDQTEKLFVINYKTKLPNGQIRQVRALIMLSASGNELTGAATVKLLSKNGSVVDIKNVTVIGQRAISGLATKP